MDNMAGLQEVQEGAGHQYRYPELDNQKLKEEHSAMSIEIMNRAIKMMNEQFIALGPRMFLSSDLYHHALNGQTWTTTLNKTSTFVQIHFIDEPYAHFLLSMRKDGQVSVYDSIKDTRHIKSLLPQLRMIYEDVSENDVQNIVLQTQGNEDSNLCGFFAIANAVSLLKGEAPKPFDKGSMRNHLCDCLEKGTFSTFPLCTDTYEDISRHNTKKQEEVTPMHGRTKKLLDNEDVKVIREISKIKIGSVSEVDHQGYRYLDETDLNNLLSCCGRKWRHVVMFITMPDHIRIRRMPPFQVKSKVFNHFLSDAGTNYCSSSETTTKDEVHKKYTKFDAFVLDVLSKIYLLTNVQVHLDELKNVIQSKNGILTVEELKSIFKVVQDFKMFWAIFDMPHLNVALRLNWFTNTDSEFDEIDMELFRLNLKIEKISASNNITKEKEKFLQFLENDALVKLALTSRRDLLDRICVLASVNIDLELLQKNFGSVGVPEGMETMMQCHKLRRNANKIDTHNNHVLENNSFIGEFVQSTLGKGTSGWCLQDNSNRAYLTTSLHVIFDSDKMKNLVNHYHGCMDHGELAQLHSFGCGWADKLIRCELDCNISSNKVLFEVCKAIYMQGSDATVGLVARGYVELAVMKMKKSKSENKKDTIESPVQQNILQQWSELKLPKKLEFNGICISYNDLSERTIVYKIGSKTGITKGKILEKEKSIKCAMLDGNYSMQLDDQVAVEWTDNLPFSEPGDSGAPVFILNLESGEMFAVGMVQSSQEDKKRSIITHISHILEACKGYRLKPFKIILEEKF